MGILTVALDAMEQAQSTDEYMRGWRLAQRVITAQERGERMSARDALASLTPAQRRGYDDALVSAWGF